MKFGCLNCFFLSTTNLICRSTDISKCFSGSLRFRDNENRLSICLDLPSLVLSLDSDWLISFFDQIEEFLLLLDQFEDRITFSSYCKFFAQITLFLPHDYTCLFQRVGRYDGAFGF